MPVDFKQQHYDFIDIAIR